MQNAKLKEYKLEKSIKTKNNKNKIQKFIFFQFTIWLTNFLKNPHH